jgi:hypothetical protein
VTAPPPSTLKYSGRLARKGILLEESYRIFACWNLDQSLRENITRIRETNPIGASNQAWLREVTATISSRYSTGDSLAPLVTLAKGGLNIDTWKFCLLWHLGNSDGMLVAFLSAFLLPKVESGIEVFTAPDLVPFVRELVSERLLQSSPSADAARRIANDLLRCAATFGFLTGRTKKRLAHATLPEAAVLYAIYSLWEEHQSADRLISSPRWMLFLFRTPQVEHELLNLHQFRRLHYERAGSIRELSLPHANLMAFAQSLVA